MKLRFSRILKILIFSLIIIGAGANVFFINLFIKNQNEIKNQISEYKEEVSENEEDMISYEKKNHNLISNYLNYKAQNEPFIPYEVKAIWTYEPMRYHPAITTKPYNMEYENTINELLYDVFCSWYPEEENYIFEGISWHKCDSKYLSVDIFYNKNLIGENIYNTIDMKQQKIVYLNDLIEVDADFVDKLTSIGVLKQDINEAGNEANVFRKNKEYEKLLAANEVYDKEIILDNLKKCSKPYNEKNYFRKPAFYLSNGRLYFYNVIFNKEVDYVGRLDEFNTYVELDDIEDKLKVDKW